ncbi:hypothetical protein [Pandoraea aquatica]|uniref:hypothetical protein n=1 Tax=Pandoraea aquatica TaxID=2508290 RepID=UPI00123FCAEF|nr:hypothetical protein [Pandoraea aquatica]
MRLYSIRRLDPDVGMASLDRATNRLYVDMTPHYRTANLARDRQTLESSLHLARRGHEAFRTHIASVHSVRDGTEDGLRPPSYPAAEPSAPEALSDTHAPVGRPYGDPPPPYAPLGQLPELLPPGPPPAYSAEDAWQSHFVRPSAPPPGDEQSPLSRYLDAGHPRSDV